MTKDQLVAEIDDILPQTQCRQCGFAGCRPYAAAIAEGLADINQCPPGGERGIIKLAELLGVSPKPLNTAHGFPKPRAVAFINEEACIGCTLCILACPVDAIVGAAKQAHTVVTEECTGCELCIPPCPMCCISMIPLQPPAPGRDSGSHATSRGYSTEDEERKAAHRARARHQFRLQRLEREKKEREEKLVQKAEAEKCATNSREDSSATGNIKKAIIQAAMERALAARALINGKNDGNNGNNGTARS